MELLYQDAVLGRELTDSDGMFQLTAHRDLPREATAQVRVRYEATDTVQDIVIGDDIPAIQIIVQISQSSKPRLTVRGEVGPLIGSKPVDTAKKKKRR